MRENALLVGVQMTGDSDSDFEERLRELALLAKTAGARIVCEVTQRRDKPDGARFVGEGKAQEIREKAEESGASVVMIDHELSPNQIKNLEKDINLKVLDRTEIILDIFATHARSKQARLQVELAQLEYTLPRLRGQWQHLERIAGSRGTGGGMGTRGPGEKQLEVDRRIAADQIVRLKRELEEIDKRKTREIGARSENFTVALVGYTNAGKSTLMNQLTGADVLVEDKLFSTLDTKTHVRDLKGGLKVLISDTVGFIRQLPHKLVASFHATLEEVIFADLLLHVVDASHANAEGQIASVDKVLDSLGCHEKDRVIVFNKMDAVTDRVAYEMLRSRHPAALEISARTGNGLAALDEEVGVHLERRQVEVNLTVPAGDGKLYAFVMQNARIIERKLKGETWHLHARIAPWHLSKLPPSSIVKEGEAVKKRVKRPVES